MRPKNWGAMRQKNRGRKRAWLRGIAMGLLLCAVIGTFAACQNDNSNGNVNGGKDNASKENETLAPGKGTEAKGDFAYESDLPVLYITTDTKNKIGDYYAGAAMLVQGADGEALTADTGYDGAIQIKLRGNSTRNLDKQPYHIKLESKTNLLGMGENKHWLLLAEAIDHTLLRNQLVLKFAREIGMEEASNAMSVVLCLNGKYRGVYTLCEQVRIGDSTVDIMDWDELAEDLAKDIAKEKAAAEPALGEEEVKAFRAALEEKLGTDYSWASAPYTYTYQGTTYTMTDYEDIPTLTGGWLLEMDFYHEIHDVDSVRTAYLQNFYFSEPSMLYTNAEAKDYAKRYLQSFEYALHSSDFTYHDDVRHEKTTSEGAYFDWTTGEWNGTISTMQYSDPEHDGWRYDDFVDMDSLVNNFLVCEFSRNWDCMKNSTFLYKDVDGLAKMGPAWDYDWAFGNINMYQINTNYPTGWQTTDKYFTNEQYYQNYNWNRYLIQDPVFVQALYDKYHEIRPTVIEELVGEGGWMETTMLAQSKEAYANDKLWSFTYHQYGGEKYDDACKNLKTFIGKRVAWLDAQFADYDTLYASLNSGYQAEGWWN